jgi:hypothetical protein
VCLQFAHNCRTDHTAMTGNKNPVVHGHQLTFSI